MEPTKYNNIGTSASMATPPTDDEIQR
jgi:hypothetical protein